MSDEHGSVGSNGRLDVHLVEPEREVWSGRADFVVTRTAEGDMGVLPSHEPSFSLLAVGPVMIRRTGAPDVVAAVSGGFLSVSPVNADGTTRVDILGDAVVLPEEVTAESIAALESRARDLASSGDVAESMEVERQVNVYRRITERDSNA